MATTEPMQTDQELAVMDEIERQTVNRLDAMLRQAQRLREKMEKEKVVLKSVCQPAAAAVVVKKKKRAAMTQSERSQFDEMWTNIVEGIAEGRRQRAASIEFCFEADLPRLVREHLRDRLKERTDVNLILAQTGWELELL